MEYYNSMYSMNTDIVGPQPEEMQPIKAEKTSFLDKLRQFLLQHDKLTLLLSVLAVIVLAVIFSLALIWVQRLSSVAVKTKESVELSAQPEPTAITASESSAQQSPTPQPTGSATPKPSTVPTPTPATPTPTPSPKPNLSFVAQSQELMVQPIIKAYPNDIQAGDLVNTPDGKSFYYKYHDLGGPPVNNTTTFPQGDNISFMVAVQNSGVVAAPASTLTGTLNFTDGTSFTKQFAVEGIGVGESRSFSLASELLLQKTGKATVRWVLDSASTVSESNELDNEKTVSITINPDTVKPFMHVYNPILQRVGDEICFDYKNMHTRDNLDALEGSEPSTRTEVRYKPSSSNSFTGWYKYLQINTIQTECVPAVSGQSYNITVEARDQAGNTDSLTKSLSVQ